jgi:hypothetical protein
LKWLCMHHQSEASRAGSRWPVFCCSISRSNCHSGCTRYRSPGRSRDTAAPPPTRLEESTHHAISIGDAKRTTARRRRAIRTSAEDGVEASRPRHSIARYRSALQVRRARFAAVRWHSDVALGAAALIVAKELDRYVHLSARTNTASAWACASACVRVLWCTHLKGIGRNRDRVGT